MPENTSLLSTNEVEWTAEDEKRWVEQGGAGQDEEVNWSKAEKEQIDREAQSRDEYEKLWTGIAESIADNPEFDEVRSGLLGLRRNRMSLAEKYYREDYETHSNNASRVGIDLTHATVEEGLEAIRSRAQELLEEREASTREGKQAGGSISKRKKYYGGGLLEDDRQAYQEGDIVSDEEEVILPNEPATSFAEGDITDSLLAEESLAGDEEVENDYLDFIINESLEPEDEEYLTSTLEADPRLSMIFDQLMDTALEFSGSGPVEGPGSEVSDSIPARLSDGEFVFTAKAADEIGPDNLQGMMTEAEANADKRQLAQRGGLIQPYYGDNRPDGQQDRPVDDEIRKGMLGVNPRLQATG